MKSYKIISLCIASLMPLTVSADFGLSTNVSNHNDIFGSDLTLSVGLEYRGEKLNIEGNELSFSLSKNDSLNFELIATSHNYERDNDDSDLTKGMNKRKASIDVGGRAFVTTPLGYVSLEATRDVRASNGVTADLKFGGLKPHFRWEGQREVNIAGVAGVRYQSKKTANYYYGVRSSEETSDRAQYNADELFIPYIGVESRLALNEKISFNAGLIYENLDDNIKNSPITDDEDYDVKANLGVTYWF